MKGLKVFFVCGLLVSLPKTSTCQDNIGIHFIFLTWHPEGDKMAFLQPNKLDPEAKLVLNWGAVVHYERFIYKERWSIKVAQAAYSDCARLFAGHTHLGVRYNLINTERHDLRLSLGPTYIYRESWYRFEGYEQQNKLLKSHGNWQTAFVWYGAEIEYDFQIKRSLDVNLHIIPGLPDFVTFGIGVRYWLRPPPFKAGGSITKGKSNGR